MYNIRIDRVIAKIEEVDRDSSEHLSETSVEYRVSNGEVGHAWDAAAPPVLFEVGDSLLEVTSGSDDVGDECLNRVPWPESDVVVHKDRCQDMLPLCKVLCPPRQ